MRTVLDHLCVGLVLAASLGYVVLAMGPKSLRRRAAGALASSAARVPSAWQLRRTVQRLGEALGAKPAGACGGCDSCDGNPGSAAREVRVPLARLGRRRVTSR
jgi:hypothetical protein